MRLLTGIIAAIAALLDWLFGAVRDAIWPPDPAAEFDAAEAQVRAEIADLDAVDDSPTAVARRFLAGDNRGYSGLPMRAKCWLILAADRNVVLEDASDREVASWLGGAAEHPRVPLADVAAVARGEHACRGVRLPRRHGGMVASTVACVLRPSLA